MTLTDQQRALAENYEIDFEDGVYTDITPLGAANLIFNFLSQITETMRQLVDRRAKHGLSDDDYDYTNALAGQFALWHNLEFWGMDNSTPVTHEILSILNITREDIEGPNAPAYDDYYCLKYGFADHGTHLSDLAHMNDDE